MQRLSDYTDRIERREFVRGMLARAWAGWEPDKGDAVTRAIQLWPDEPQIADALRIESKAAVGGIELDTSVPAAASSFAKSAFAATVLGRLPGGRREPFQDSVLFGRIIGTGGSWRKPGAAVPITKASVGRASLVRHNTDAALVASNEFVKYATIDNSAADMLSKLLIDDLRKKHDPVFTGANAAIAGQQPAGIAYNAVPIASTGATAAATITDTRSMIAAQVDGVGSARDGLFISSTEAYSFLAMLKVLDADGRTLGGLPIISGAPSGTFLLLDASSLSYAVDDAARVRVSTSGTVEMSDAPTGNTITPTAATNSNNPRVRRNTGFSLCR